MSESRNILFCTDFSEHADTAFDHAVDQAKKYNAKLHIMHVIMPSDPCGYSPMNKTAAPDSANRSTDSEEDLAQQAIGAMKLKYSELLNDSVQNGEFIVKIGSTDVEVIRYATQNNIDMIIICLKSRITPTGWMKKPRKICSMNSFQPKVIQVPVWA